jgi:hypothetical protein
MNEGVSSIGRPPCLWRLIGLLDPNMLPNTGKEADIRCSDRMITRPHRAPKAAPRYTSISMWLMLAKSAKLELWNSNKTYRHELPVWSKLLVFKEERRWPNLCSRMTCGRASNRYCRDIRRSLEMVVRYYPIVWRLPGFCL